MENNIFYKNKVELLHIILLLVLFWTLIWSFIEPKDEFIWFLEVFPVFIGLSTLIFTYNKFRLTNLLYILILFHMIILIIGGHYTYAEMPAFNWLKNFFHLERNYYDRFAHFFQGFIPAIIAREILLRKSPMKQGKLLFFIITCICLSVSALYELLEWWVAVLTGEAAADFLGTQGDVWDTQWDMFLALLGAIASLLIMSNFHNKSLKKFGIIIKNN